MVRNYRLTSGFFAGRIIGLGQPIIDVPIDQLDPALQQAVLEYGEQYKQPDGTYVVSINPVPLETLVPLFENSWCVELTAQPINLLPISERDHNDQTAIQPPTPPD